MGAAITVFSGVAKEYYWSKNIVKHCSFPNSNELGR